MDQNQHIEARLAALEQENKRLRRRMNRLAIGAVVLLALAWVKMNGFTTEAAFLLISPTSRIAHVDTLATTDQLALSRGNGYTQLFSSDGFHGIKSSGDSWVDSNFVCFKTYSHFHLNTQEQSLGGDAFPDGTVLYVRSGGTRDEVQLKSTKQSGPGFILKADNQVRVIIGVDRVSGGFIAFYDANGKLTKTVTEGR
jgi:hypothetical protein